MGDTIVVNIERVDGGQRRSMAVTIVGIWPADLLDVRDESVKRGEQRVVLIRSGGSEAR